MDFYILIALGVLLGNVMTIGFLAVIGVILGVLS